MVDDTSVEVDDVGVEEVEEVGVEDVGVEEVEEVGVEQLDFEVSEDEGVTVQQSVEEAMNRGSMSHQS